MGKMEFSYGTSKQLLVSDIIIASWPLYERSLHARPVPQERLQIEGSKVSELNQLVV